MPLHALFGHHLTQLFSDKCGVWIWQSKGGNSNNNEGNCENDDEDNEKYDDASYYKNDNDNNLNDVKDDTVMLKRVESSTERDDNMFNSGIVTSPRKLIWGMSTHANPHALMHCKACPKFPRRAARCRRERQFDMIHRKRCLRVSCISEAQQGIFDAVSPRAGTPLLRRYCFSKQML